MRKAARLLFFSFSSLLLAGCGGVELEYVIEAIGESWWRSSWRLKIPPTVVWEKYGDLLATVLILVLLLLLAGVILDLWSLMHRSPADTAIYIVGFGLLIGVMIVSVLGTALLKITDIALARLSHLNLKYVIESSIGLDVNKDLFDVPLWEAASSLTVMLPKLSIAFQAMLVGASVVFLFMSLFAFQKKGLGFLGVILGGLVGHGISFFIYDGILEITKVINQAEGFESANLNAFIYLVATIVFYALSWVGLPLVGWKYFPNLVGYVGGRIFGDARTGLGLGLSGRRGSSSGRGRSLGPAGAYTDGAETGAASLEPFGEGSGKSQKDKAGPGPLEHRSESGRLNGPDGGVDSSENGRDSEADGSNSDAADEQGLPPLTEDRGLSDYSDFGDEEVDSGGGFDKEQEQSQVIPPLQSSEAGSEAHTSDLSSNVSDRQGDQGDQDLESEESLGGLGPLGFNSDQVEDGSEAEETRGETRKEEGGVHSLEKPSSDSGSDQNPLVQRGRYLDKQYGSESRRVRVKKVRPQESRDMPPLREHSEVVEEEGQEVGDGQT